MLTSNIYFFIFLLATFCIDHLSYYNVVKNVYSLTKKEKSFVLSTKVSLMMTLLGITKFFSKKNTDSFSIYTIGCIYFLSYLFTDIYVGNLDYNHYMKGLSGNIHHLSYILITILVLVSNTNITNAYLLFMISELPTFLLSIGTFKRYRNDYLFGFCFLLTRIILHFILTVYYGYGSNWLITIFGSLSFLLHVYWFKNWYNNYVTNPSRQT